MQPRHIDVADRSEEGDALASALRAGGFQVRCVDPAGLAPDARTALVVLPGDHEQALSLLDGLRRDPRTTLLPVILTGVPATGPDDPETLRRLGADAVYPRPIPVGRIVRKAQTFVIPAEQLRASVAPAVGAPLPTPPPPRSSSVPVVDATLAISAEMDSWHEDDGAGVVEDPGSEGVTPSPRVMALVREADARLFPDAPEIDLTFADPGALLEGLLQEELLSPVPLAEDAPVGTEPGEPSPSDDEDPLAEPRATTVTARALRRDRPAPAVSGTDATSVSRSRVTSIASRRPASFSGGVLGDDWPLLVVLGARRRFEAQDVLARLGPESRLRLGPDAGKHLAHLEVEATLVAWLERHDGDSLAHCLEDAPPETGAPGVVLALVALGVLDLRRGEAPVPEAPCGPAAHRGLVIAAHAKALEADYYAILGVPRDAAPPEIEAAHASLRGALLAVETLDDDLAEQREVALQALDEARRILSVDRLRQAYREALERERALG